MVDCFFDPNNAACANGNSTAPYGNYTGDDGSLDWTEDTDPMQGQISYLMVAGSMAVHAGLELFRYKTNYDGYDNYDVVSDTNWW